MCMSMKVQSNVARPWSAMSVTLQRTVRPTVRRQRRSAVTAAVEPGGGVLDKPRVLDPGLSEK